ncbi:VPLPA-CTERM sorting domain-containing protein [Epibacterium ulvae]|uniref:VPLPA-CTERM sorting domain-containing protein n=1 Tax=Epibacterium ulvae TaxID=1156985 RepID=UPI001BFC4354|nr:VPLPA-CTERM sorting domain-containing protein [Epibacterium ulvae]MBT8154562.1 VPLPA-CTERM sorting domain-containing protein [Epibacterium ulvae]
MFKRLKALAAVLTLGLVSLTALSSAQAATISGQVDIAGIVNLDASDFTPNGSVSLLTPAFAFLGTGDFAADSGTFVTTFGFDFGAVGDQTLLTLASGISFVAQSFSDLSDGAIKSFTATGFLSADGYDDSFATLSFASSGSSNTITSFITSVAPVPLPAAGILLFGALAGLGFAGRRRKALTV